MIGVRLADRSFYPVFDGLEPSRKKLVLTTVRDDQDRAEISLYHVYGDRGHESRGQGAQDDPFESNEDVGSEELLGTVILTDLSPRKQGEPDLDLALTLDEDGQLHVVATDRQGGNMQSLVIPLEGHYRSSPYQRISEGDRDFPDDPGMSSGFDDEPLPWEAPRDHRSGRLVLVLLFSLLLVLLFAAATLLFRSLVTEGEAESIPPETTLETIEPPAEALELPDVPPEPLAGNGSAPPEEVLQPQNGGVATPVGEEAPDETKAVSSAFPGEQAPEDDILYQISWGDTLWDLSLRFYGTPWRFLDIADRNRIRNPDLIFANQDLLIPGR
ncbi:Hsp70 family protein [Alkalispirochaeta alkalica]|uniref:Hsp70 family protein n=1 Tax=Alkalispirochaeta alkalica TaxID=46356 RepID=UPI000380A13C|nr:LysM peptidoglycan-binding domain-containing protein [Alkalispirochaeta alkalica]